MLGLGYPGGPIIERLAREGNPKAVKFSLPRMGDGSPDFSFSGLKTAVTKHVRETGLQPVTNGEEPSQAIKDLAASFQSVVVRSLVGTTERVGERLSAEDVDCRRRRGLQRRFARSVAASGGAFGSPRLLSLSTSLDRQRGDDRGGRNGETTGGRTSRL